MLKKTEPEIPISHTREMRQKFLKEVALISSSNIKPHMLRHMVSGHQPDRILARRIFPRGHVPDRLQPDGRLPERQKPDRTVTRLDSNLNGQQPTDRSPIDIRPTSYTPNRTVARTDINQTGHQFDPTVAQSLCSTERPNILHKYDLKSEEGEFIYLCNNLFSIDTYK